MVGAGGGRQGGSYDIIKVRLTRRRALGFDGSDKARREMPTRKL